MTEPKHELILAETTLPQRLAAGGRIPVPLQPGQQIDAHWLAAYLQCSIEDAETQLWQGIRRGQLRVTENGLLMLNERH
jgi:hypothetical protein